MARIRHTKEKLEMAVQKATTISDVLRILGMKINGGNYAHIKGRLRFYGISCEHLLGRAWSKGKTAESDVRVRRSRRSRRFSNTEIFVRNSPITNGTKLTKRLLASGWKYTCAICGLDNWLGEPLSLDLDHKNGIHNDNRKVNLRFLCPNCHRQTATWGKRKAE